MFGFPVSRFACQGREIEKFIYNKCILGLILHRAILMCDSHIEKVTVRTILVVISTIMLIDKINHRDKLF